jgi:hypothetical protein
MTRKTVAGTPADPTVKFATVEIDGKTYSLAYDFNAIATAESVTGINLFKALSTLTDLTATQFRGLVYAGLLKAHPEITLEQAGSIIRFDTMVPLQEKLAEAYKNSMPEKKENPPMPVEPAA